MRSPRDEAIEREVLALLAVVDGRDKGLRGYYIDAARFDALRAARALPSAPASHALGEKERKVVEKAWALVNGGVWADSQCTKVEAPESLFQALQDALLTHRAAQGR